MPLSNQEKATILSGKTVFTKEQHKIFHKGLKEAYSLLRKKGGWCQNSAAKTSDGFCISFDHSKATSFCVSGVMSRVGIPRFKFLAPNGPMISVVSWNDHFLRKKSEVLAMFRESIRIHAEYLKTL